MKKIGLIGGMSWESSAEYYRILNEEIKNRLGGLHSAECILYNVDFHPIENYMRNGEWNKILEILIKASKSLEKAGAELIIICTNTMHKLADEIQKEITIEIIHIANAVSFEIKKLELKTIGLLGTKFTMEEDFYKRKFQQEAINLIIPSSKDIEIVNHIIFNELCLGKFEEKSKNIYINVINDLISKGSQGIVLGCTEIPLLIKQKDVKIPLFDTTRIHAKTALEKALK